MAHGHGLFSRPDEVRSFEKAQRTQGMNAQDAAIFNAAFAGGNAIQRGFGGSTPQSPELVRALQQQEMFQGVDFTDHDAVMDLSRTFGQRGDIHEAAEIAKLAPPKNLVTKGEPYYTEITIGKGAQKRTSNVYGFDYTDRFGQPGFKKIVDVDSGTPGAASTKKVLIEQGPIVNRQLTVDGKKRTEQGTFSKFYDPVSGEVTTEWQEDLGLTTGKDDSDTDPTIPVVKLHSGFKRVPSLDEDTRLSVANQLASMEENNGVFGAAKPEDVLPHALAILELMGQMDERQGNAIRLRYAQGRANGEDPQALAQGVEFSPPTPIHTVMLDAVDLYRQGGLMDANSKKPIMGAKEAAVVKRATLAQLEVRAADNAEKTATLAKLERESGGMVQAHPLTKGFRLDSVPLSVATEAFVQIGNRHNGQLERFFTEEIGATFDNRESREWHRSNWDRMRNSLENQLFVQEWFREDTIRGRAKLAFDTAKSQWPHDVDQWAETQMIHKYLFKLTEKRDAEIKAATDLVTELGTEFEEAFNPPRGK